MARASKIAATSLGLVALLVVAALSSAGGVSAARHATTARAPRPLSLQSAPVRANRRAFRRRQAVLRSPAARARRARSRAAFRDASGRDALDIDRGHFQGVFDAPVFHGIDLRPGEHVHEYTGDNAALVDNARGVRGLAESTIPLLTRRHGGKKVPVDLSLLDAGQVIAPAAALVPVTFAKDASNGFDLPDAGVTVRPAGAAPTTAALTAGKAFYSNVMVDTDLLAQPTPSGFESYEVLRSAASPEAITFSLSVPDGAELRLVPAAGGLPAGAAVTVGGKNLIEIPPPAAHDADGRQVPASYRVEGRNLTVDVPHLSGSYRYPVLVDPGFNVPEQFYNTNGWQSGAVGGPYSAYSGSYYYGSPVPNYGWRSGLVVQANVGTYQLNSYGNLWYTPPANSYIYRGEFQYVTYGWLYQAVNQGIWNTTDGQPAISRQTGTNLDNNYLTLCAPGPNPTCDPGNGIDNNIFVLGLQNIYLTNAYYNTASAATMQSALIYERDRYAPQVTALSQNAPSGWVDTAALSATATGSDTGLGMKEFAWVQPDRSQITSTHGCSGAYGDRCPASWSATFNYNTSTLPEGVNTFGVAARDVVSNGSPETQWRVKVDRTPPSAPALSGSLWTRRNQSADHRSEGVYASAYTLDASAGDSLSGLKSIDVQVDSNPPYHYAARCSGTDGCADSIPTWTFNSDSYADGNHTITVTAKDQLADQPGVDNSRHVSTTAFQVTVDRRGDIYHATKYTGDPATGGAQLEQQWGRPGTQVGRIDDGTSIATRTTIACPPPLSASTSCDQYRLLDENSAVTPGAHDSFEQTTGSSTTDVGVPIAADILTPLPSGATATATGPINNVLNPWQNAPPAAGPTYAEYDNTVTNDPDETGTVTIKTWIDTTTRMPLKEVVLDSTGAATDTAYYTYDRDRLTTSQVAPDFFSVQPTSVVGFSEDVQHLGGGPSGSVQDTETTTGFTPYYLGTAPTSTSGGAWCLASTDIVHFNHSVPPDITDPDPDPDAQPLPAGAKQTMVDANYGALATGSPCNPGADTADDPSLQVMSYASAGSTAQAWLAQYQQTAEEIALDPSDPDFQASGSVPLLNPPTVAYALPDGNGGTTALLQTGGTTIILQGSYTKADLPFLAGSLVPR